MRCKWIFTIFAVIQFILMPANIYGNDLASGDSLSFPGVKGYDIQYNYPVYYPDNLWDLIDGAADAFVQYGFVDLHIAEYVKGGDHITKVEVYRHKNSVFAFGMYAAERSPDYHFIPLGIQGYAEEGLLFFVKGPYYVKVTTHDEDKHVSERLMEIATAIQKSLPGSVKKPAGFSKFPKKDKNPDSEHFIPDNFLGYSFLSEVYTIEYKTETSAFSAFMIKLKNSDAVNSVISKFKEKAVNTTSLPGGIIRIEDRYNGVIFLSPVDNLLTGTMGKAEQTEMTSFLAGFKRSLQ